MRQEDDLESVVRGLEEEIERLAPLKDEANQKQWRIKRGQLAKAQFELFKKIEHEDPDRAVELLLSSAEKGHYLAGARLYTKSHSDGLDLACKEDLEKMDSNSLFRRGLRVCAGVGGSTNQSLAFQCIESAAMKDHLGAQAFLGWMYRSGMGVAADLVKSIRWLELAASKGSMTAEYFLGVTYQKNLKDSINAAHYFLMAANKGFGLAQGYYAYMCANGVGVTQDNIEAFRWYQMACEQGLSQAQNNLAMMYFAGNGVRKDAVKGLGLLRLAAEQGVTSSQLELGRNYYSGVNAPQNYVEAVKFFHLAADQGDARAQYNLGWCYANGEGVSRDDVKAAYWLKLAAKQGDAGAKKGLERLRKQGRGISKDPVRVEPIKKPDPKDVLALLNRGETKAINAEFFKNLQLIKPEFLQLFNSLNEKEQDSIITFLSKNILIGGENWRDQYDVLVLISDSVFEAAKMQLENCNLEIVKRSCRLINQNLHLGKSQEASEFFAHLESFVKKLEAHPKRDQHYQYSYDFAKRFIENHYIQLSEKLLRSAQSGDKLALQELETLAKTRKEAQVLCGAYYESEATVLFDKLNKKEINDFWGSKRSEANALAQKAFQHYEEARKNGSSEAAYRCGLFLEKGVNAPADFKRAIYFYHQSAIKNNPAAKTKLKEWSHQTEFTDLAILANIYESFSQELVGDPEYSYGNYYLSTAYEIEKAPKLFFECLHELLLNDEYGFNIRLPLAQLIACKNGDRKALYLMLDSLLVQVKDPSARLSNHQMVYRYVTAATLCEYALYKFDDVRDAQMGGVDFDTRLMLMGLAAEKSKESAYENPLFDEKYRLVEAKIQLLIAEGKILPPKPSAPLLSNELSIIEAAEARVEFNREIKEAKAEKPVRKTYEKRLAAIHFEGEIPEDFLCEISNEIMDPPVISSNGKHWNEATFEKNKKANQGKNPLNSDAKLEEKAFIDLKLKSKIEAFIEGEEKKYAEKLSAQNVGVIKITNKNDADASVDINANVDTDTNADQAASSPELAALESSPSPPSSRGKALGSGHQTKMDPANQSQDDVEVDAMHVQSPNLSSNNAAFFASPKLSVDEILDNMPAAPTHTPELPEEPVAPKEEKPQMEMGH